MLCDKICANQMQPLNRNILVQGKSENVISYISQRLTLIKSNYMLVWSLNYMLVLCGGHNTYYYYILH